MNFINRLGILIGFLVTTFLVSVLLILHVTLGMPFIPFDIFDGLVRISPGSLVTAGIEILVGVLQLLGLSLRNSSKIAEQVQAVTLFLAGGTIIGSIAFNVLSTGSVRSIFKSWAGLGVVIAVPVSIVLTLTGNNGSGPVLSTIWILLAWTVWGIGLGWTGRQIHQRTREAHVAAPPGSSVESMDGRRFVIKLAGATAAVTVVGIAVSRVMKTQNPDSGVRTPYGVDMPNRYGTMLPAPGTRPEYTPVQDHFRIDIDLLTPRIEAGNWRLPVTGLVEHPLELTLEQIRSFPEPLHLFVTLSCISNPLGGDLIGTTQWSGVSVQRILSQAVVRPGAQFLRVTSSDGFHETVPMDLIQSDERVMFAYAWDNKPLTPKHGFPLRIYIPDRYGMKQPKWITGLELVSEYTPGYWVERGWDEIAQIKATSVIDTVAVDSLVETGSEPLIPIGGIAYAGTRGISRVEVRIDEGEWQPAQLRTPLSNLTWVIWRYDWPFRSGDHQFQVRCYDGAGRMQITEKHSPHPSGATGIYTTTTHVGG